MAYQLGDVAVEMLQQLYAVDSRPCVVIFEKEKLRMRAAKQILALKLAKSRPTSDAPGLRLYANHKEMSDEKAYEGPQSSTAIPINGHSSTC